MRPCNNALFAALLAGAAFTLGAQERPAPSTPAQAVPWAVQLPVLVTGRDQRPATGLKQDNFTILENDRPQQIATLAKTDEPFSVGIILDLSRSMAPKLNPARQAILRFIQASNPQDEFFVVGFADHVGLIQDFTNSAGSVQMGLATVGASGKRTLFDGLDFGLTKMKEARYARKALLVVTDGADNQSNLSEGKLRARAGMEDVEVYSMGIFNPYAATPEERSGPELLDELGEETGGRLFRVDDIAEMGDIAAKISTELRNQYLIGYRPSDPALDGKWRKVKVKINPSPGLPRLNVHARSGYYAPSQ